MLFRDVSLIGRGYAAVPVLNHDRAAAARVLAIADANRPISIEFLLKVERVKYNGSKNLQPEIVPLLKP